MDDSSSSSVPFLLPVWVVLLLLPPPRPFSLPKWCVSLVLCGSSPVQPGLWVAPRSASVLLSPLPGLGTLLFGNIPKKMVCFVMYVGGCRILDWNGKPDSGEDLNVAFL